MVRLGVILLVHTALERAAQVARVWANAGCDVIVHLDKKIPTAIYHFFSPSCRIFRIYNFRIALIVIGVLGGWLQQPKPPAARFWTAIRISHMFIWHLVPACPYAQLTN